MQIRSLRLAYCDLRQWMHFKALIERRYDNSLLSKLKSMPSTMNQIKRNHNPGSLGYFVISSQSSCDIFTSSLCTSFVYNIKVTSFPSNYLILNQLPHFSGNEIVICIHSVRILFYIMKVTYDPSIKLIS